MRDAEASKTKPRGPHPDKRLTAVKVRALRTPGRYADGNGLYLVVEPSGAKRWILRTVIAGKRCDLGLGGTALVSLADVREESARLRKMARAGGNPLVERRRKRTGVPTFRDAAKQVHAAHSSSFRNTKHKAQWLDSLASDVFPIFGDRTVDAVDTADVLRALSRVWTVKPETARRLKQRIKVVLDWAIASGFRTAPNPVDGITKALPRHRREAKHHPALPYAEVPAFIRTLRSADAGIATKLAFEFLILTASRTNEVVRARWEEFDLKQQTWTVPATRMKAGRAHRVPLPPRCVAIIREADTLAEHHPFVFGGRLPRSPLSNMAFLMLLRRIKRTDITAHGFRSSFRDWAAEQTSFARAVCEAALAHNIHDKTEAAYHRTDLFDQRLVLMEQWSTFVTSAVGRHQE